MITEVVALAGLLTGILNLSLTWRQRFVLRRDAGRLRNELDSIQDCLRQTDSAGAELPRDGWLSVAARARVLEMLRSGMAAEEAAAEMGLAGNEIRLLEKVAMLPLPRW